MSDAQAKSDAFFKAEVLSQIERLKSRIAELEKELAEVKSQPRIQVFSPPLWTSPRPVIDVECVPDQSPTVEDPPKPPGTPSFGDFPVADFTCKNSVDNQNGNCDSPRHE